MVKIVLKIRHDQKTEVKIRHGHMTGSRSSRSQDKDLGQAGSQDKSQGCLQTFCGHVSSSIAHTVGRPGLMSIQRMSPFLY